jgi:trimethylamine--corrinoid protein Co-methyltransferase
LSNVFPKMTMLGQEDRLLIHQASCEILRKTGVQVHNRAALDLLKQAGALVKEELVMIPPSMVEWALASAPDRFNLYLRGSEEIAIRLDGKGVYFGTGSDTLHYMDPRSGNRREFMLADIADCMHVLDALPEIGF